VTPRVVLDSNVIVSGLGWSGPPARILDAALDGRLVLVTSPPLLAELRRVRGYPKLAKVIARAQLAESFQHYRHCKKQHDGSDDDEHRM